MLAMMLTFGLLAAPVELWGGLTVGMSKAEVQEKYPTREVELGSECKAKINTGFRGDQLDSLALLIRVNGSDGMNGRKRCADIVMSGLTTKYGTPISTSVEHKYAGGAFDRENTVWASGDVRITFHFTPGANLSSVSYDYAPVTSTPDVSNKL